MDWGDFESSDWLGMEDLLDDLGELDEDMLSEGWGSASSEAADRNESLVEGAALVTALIVMATSVTKSKKD